MCQFNFYGTLVPEAIASSWKVLKLRRTSSVILANRKCLNWNKFCSEMEEIRRRKCGQLKLVIEDFYA